MGVSSLHLIFYVFPILDGHEQSVFLIGGAKRIFSTKQKVALVQALPYGRPRLLATAAEILESGMALKGCHVEFAEDRPA
jgi:hypothetical protein